MGSLTQVGVLLFAGIVYIVLFILVVIVVLSIKRIAKAQQENAITNKEIVKQLSIIATELNRKNTL